MKKLFSITLLALATTISSAADYSIYFQQKLPGGVPGFRSIILDEPTANAFYLYNLSNHQPEQFTFDSTITCNTTTHVCSVPTTVGPAGPNGIDGATGPAGAKGDKGDPGVNSWAAIPDKPTTFAPSPHTTSLLTDMTSAGRAIATATDAAAMRMLLDVPNTAAVSAKADKATTLAGYGITDGVTSAALSTALSAKFNTPAGSTAQYVRGDGSLATLPTATIINRVVATTATDGTYTWTFPTACSGTPAVSVTPQNNTSAEVINHKVTAVSSTSMSISLSRAILTLTSIPLLSNITLPIVQTTTGAQTVHLIAICP